MTEKQKRFIDFYIQNGKRLPIFTNRRRGTSSDARQKNFDL